MCVYLVIIKEIITNNEEDGMNYLCQGVRGATNLPSRWMGGGEDASKLNCKVCGGL